MVLEKLSVVALHLCQGLSESDPLLLELDSFELVLHCFTLPVALVCGLFDGNGGLVAGCGSRGCLSWQDCSLRRVDYSGLTLDVPAGSGLDFETIAPALVLYSWGRRWRFREIDDGWVDVLWNDLELLQGIFGTLVDAPLG